MLDESGINGHGLAQAWLEAKVMFRIGQETGNFASVRKDILPAADTDRGMKFYRLMTLTFFDMFVRRGSVPRRKPQLRLPRTPAPPWKGPRTWRERLGPEKLAELRAALRAGRSAKELANSYHTAQGNVRELRRELEMEAEAVNAG